MSSFITKVREIRLLPTARAIKRLRDAGNVLMAGGRHPAYFSAGHYQELSA